MSANTEKQIISVTFSHELELLLGVDLNSQFSNIVDGKQHNYKKGEKQTVYPIKKRESLIDMANWLLKNKDTKYVLAFVLGINLGLRANELLKLKVKHVFNKDGSVRYIEDIEDTSDRIDIYQSKTKKYRAVFLNLACKEALEWFFPIRDKDYIMSIYNDYLFPSREGGFIQVNTLRKVIKDAAEACGIMQNIGTHTLRKTWGWNQYKHNCDKANLDISMLQRAFGHSSTEVTLRYLGITDEEDKALYHNMCLYIISSEMFGF